VAIFANVLKLVGIYFSVVQGQRSVFGWQVPMISIPRWRGDCLLVFFSDNFKRIKLLNLESESKLSISQSIQLYFSIVDVVVSQKM